MGFKGGLNICSFRGQDVINGASSLTGGNIGLFKNTRFDKTTSLQIELSVSWEGETYNSPTVLQSNGSFKYTYLNLPVLLQEKLAKGLNAETGSQLGLLLSAIENQTSTSVYSGTTGSSDFSGSVTPLNFG